MARGRDWASGMWWRIARRRRDEDSQEYKASKACAGGTANWTCEECGAGRAGAASGTGAANWTRKECGAGRAHRPAAGRPHL